MNGDGTKPTNGNGNGDTEALSVADSEEYSNFKKKLEQGNLTPKDVHEGLSLLGLVGEETLGNSIRNGNQLTTIHEHLHQDRESIVSLRGQLGIVVTRTEATNKFLDKLDSSVVDGFSRVANEVGMLKAEVNELFVLVSAVAKHFGVEVETKSDCPAVMRVIRSPS
jgi:flagellin-like hook-associated protein FlgL